MLPGKHFGKNFTPAPETSNWQGVCGQLVPVVGRWGPKGDRKIGQKKKREKAGKKWGKSGEKVGKKWGKSGGNRWYFFFHGVSTWRLNLVFEKPAK